MSDQDPEFGATEPAEQAAATMAAAGMPRMPARVLMALIAAPAGGYTAEQLSRRLGVSPAAVSGAVRYLQDLRFVHRRSQPGDRRARYEVLQDAFSDAIAGNAPVYERMAGFIDRIGIELADDPEAAARTAELAAFFRFVAVGMPQLTAQWRQERGTTPPGPR